MTTDSHDRGPCMRSRGGAVIDGEWADSPRIAPATRNARAIHERRMFRKVGRNIAAHGDAVSLHAGDLAEALRSHWPFSQWLPTPGEAVGAAGRALFGTPVRRRAWTVLLLLASAVTLICR